MTDYFSKGIEVEPFVQVHEKHVISFMKRNIICRYGIPAEIICDNGSQFIGHKTTSFCDAWKIDVYFSSPSYPQANGQVESSNKIIMNNIKKKLESKKGKWAELLPFVLWADRTTSKNATGQTPFSLVFGCEVILPAELMVPTYRIQTSSPEVNNNELLNDLDNVEELRDTARIRLSSYKQVVTNSFNKNVRIRRFQVGDWVLRKVNSNTREKGAGKLGANWEGPYQVDSISGGGAYRLITPSGGDVERPWNAHNLKLYHR